jgi:dGTPase
MHRHPDRRLAPWAAHDDNSRGRRFAEPPPRLRGQFQRDRDRIIHCTAFRRLVYKTQVFVNHEGDLYRTRLTHSLEVAQIGRTVAQTLGLNEYLVEAIALAHDLGHTPFGHAGQDALNGCMREYGGFEHNLQSLRVVDELEEKYADFNGLNLTFETREGVLKHCSLKNARQLGELGLRFIDRTQPSLEAQLANLADEIAYNNHDIDDGLRAGLLDMRSLQEVVLFRRQYEAVRSAYPALEGRRLIHEIVRRMIDTMVGDLAATTSAQLFEADPASLEAVRMLGSPLVGFSAEMTAHIRDMKRYLHEHLYRHFRVLRMTIKARRVVEALFEAFINEPRLMPDAHTANAAAWQAEHGDSGRARAVSDYIAGMTDRFAITEYERLTDPRRST